MNGLHVVLPAGIDDPARPSGGNVYDRRLCRELASTGWPVHEYAVPGAWPDASPADQDGLGEVLRTIADGARVLVDGLVASAAPAPVLAHADRLRVAVLVHLPLGVTRREDRTSEADVLAAAHAIVTTSLWTRDWLAGHYDLPLDRITVAWPGADHAASAPGTAAGRELLCVGAVTTLKGHDVLLEALLEVADLPWRCTCVGSLAIEPDLVRRLRARAEAADVGDRFLLAGPRVGPALEAAYRDADLLVLASRAETYGMVVTEALAHGIPVLAADIGGVPEALGHAPDGHLPGLLVPPADAGALAHGVRTWLETPGLRAALRRAAHGRRAFLPTWAETAAAVRGALDVVLAS